MIQQSHSWADIQTDSNSERHAAQGPGGRPAPAAPLDTLGRPAARGCPEQRGAHAHWSTTAARGTAPPCGHAGDAERAAARRASCHSHGEPGTGHPQTWVAETHGQRTQRRLRGCREEGRRGVDWEVRVSRGKPVPKGRATRPHCAYRRRPFNAPGRTAPERAGKRRQRAAESPAPQKSAQHGESTIRQ